ncbi:hypothetical protein, partial [Ralstonia pseudosolanacearum]|uniref:hypothetical protein n=1 Tax=Ralstonia pseudosolanacearum TaxID=1310165 RepID=UPI001FF7D8AB
MSSRISGFWGRHWPDLSSQSDDRDEKKPVVSKAQAREVYEHSVLFHGTTLRSRRSIQRNGFRLENIESALLNLKNVSARFHATLDAAAWPVAVV